MNDNYGVGVLKVRFLFFFFRLKFEKCCALEKRTVTFYACRMRQRPHTNCWLCGIDVDYSAHVGVLFDASSVIVLAVMAKLNKKTFPFPQQKTWRLQCNQGKVCGFQMH